MSHCDKCSWSRVKEPLPFCEAVQSNGNTYCERFFPQEELEEEKMELICPHCRREKDPGKCWWCGN